MLLVVAVVDLGLRKFTGFAAVDLLSGKAFLDWRKGVFLLGILVLIVMQTRITKFLSDDGATNVVETHTKFEDGDLHEKKREIHQQSSMAISESNKTISELEKDLKAFDKGEKKLIDDAISSKGFKMKELYLAGNLWAKEQLTPALKEANKRFKRERGKIKESLIKAKKNHIAIQESNRKNEDNLLAIYTKKENHSIVQTEQRLKRRKLAIYRSIKCCSLGLLPF